MEEDQQIEEKKVEKKVKKGTKKKAKVEQEEPVELKQVDLEVNQSIRNTKVFVIFVSKKTISKPIARNSKNNASIVINLATGPKIAFRNGMTTLVTSAVRRVTCKDIAPIEEKIEN